jgi:hypothetical protein
VDEKDSRKNPTAPSARRVFPEAVPAFLKPCF